ncbi:hypothetical protein L596_015266 [Steinernema carpocapsae]|uniref:Uncharacterized protein n=1 Tax=Steinernema carpocapsae TaxID=34508 RepID=A0A4U5NFE8_STECR|nr:hypothetical protein L596_015266 [Steinernema carpocapsae]
MRLGDPAEDFRSLETQINPPFFEALETLLQGAQKIHEFLSKQKLFLSILFTESLRGRKVSEVITFSRTPN